jgi:nucleoside-diphosphate-sugar epimerase
MVGGLANLLAASKQHGVTRFVHLSSVAVYGDPPPAGSEHEEAPTNPAPGTYGWTKLQQDRLVQQAAKAGLPSVILCPPNISGPYSYYLVSLVDALRTGGFALLDNGTNPCNLVDVANLSHAIELALDTGPTDGARLFITDDAKTTWRDVVESVLPLIEAPGPLQGITSDLLSANEGSSARATPSLLKSLKHLVSSDVREAMRKDPLWAKIDVALRGAVARMGPRVEGALRLSVEGPTHVPKMEPQHVLNWNLCRQQLRDVQHSCELAKQQLGYKPVYSVAESMEAFRKWYRAHHGMDGPAWPLLRQLH